MTRSKMVGGKIKKRSFFKKYNPIRSFKNFFGLTKKETWNEKQKRHKQEFKAWKQRKKEEKKKKNNKKRSKKKK